MAEVVRGVTSTILVGAFTLLGVIVGIVAERLVRNVGGIWCEPQEEWEPVLGFLDSRTGDWGRPPAEDPGQAPDYATYNFTLDLFNSKEIPVGLRRIRVVFECAGGTISSTPQDPATSRESAGMRRTDPVSIINLPPRQVVSQIFSGFFRGEDVDTLAGWKVARFVAEYPGRRWYLRKKFNEVIARRRD